MRWCWPSACETARITRSPLRPMSASVERMVQYGRSLSRQKVMSNPIQVGFRDRLMPLFLKLFANPAALDWVYSYQVEWDEPVGDTTKAVEQGPRLASFSCGAARLTRRPQPPWRLSSRLPDFGPFFVALVIPGAGLVDPGQRLTRIAGVPSPLLSAAATILTAGVGCYLARSGDAAASCEARCASRGCFYPRAGMRTFPLWESSETEHPMEGRKE